jgi:hypothetical protein
MTLMANGKIGGKLHRQKPWESIEMQKEIRN